LLWARIAICSSKDIKQTWIPSTRWPILINCNNHKVVIMYYFLTRTFYCVYLRPTTSNLSKSEGANYMYYTKEGYIFCIEIHNVNCTKMCIIFFINYIVCLIYDDDRVFSRTLTVYMSRWMPRGGSISHRWTRNGNQYNVPVRIWNVTNTVDNKVFIII